MLSHSLSATTPDDPAFEIRPSHWNQEHVQFLTISGNTAGQSTHSGTNLVFQGGPNATLSINGNTLVFSGGAGAAGNTGFLSAGGATASLGTILFSNDSGVSFGINGQTLTASVKTDYLTTAALSNHSHGVSFTSGSTVFQTLSFTNSNGISFNSGTQGIFASHNAITTARASTDAVGLNTAQTNVTWTVNSSGLSLNAGGYAGTGLTTATTAGTAIVGTNNTAGLSLGVPAYITTARASNDAIGLNTAQSNVTWTANSSGLSLDARGYAGTGTSATNASITLNSNGLAISVANPGGGAGSTMSYWEVPGVPNGATQGLGNGNLMVQPMLLEQALIASQLNIALSMSVSSSSNSSHAGVISLSAGIYTLNASTFSLASSGSTAYQFSNTSNNSMSVLSSLRIASIPINITATPGDYYVAIWSRTSTTNANWFTASWMAANNVGTGMAAGALFGVTNNSYQGRLGQFNLTASFATAMPATIPPSSISGTVLPRNYPWFNFLNKTA